MRFGQDGPALLKPEENGGLGETGGEESEGEAVDGSMVIYDPLPPEEEIKRNNKTDLIYKLAN